MTKLLEKEFNQVKAWPTPRMSGRVTHVVGLLIEASSLDTFINELCIIYSKDNRSIPSQVVGFKERKVLLMPLGEMTHIAPGAEVYPTGRRHCIGVSESLRGRILDGLGNPIDGKGAIGAKEFYPVMRSPPLPLSRKAIDKPLISGIKAIDGLCTLGVGQRIGIFSGPGVGKSTLMGMLARQATSDINVIALIGERGREVREFIKELGDEGLARSVVVVVTSDQVALLRSLGAHVATTIAEYFRDLGKEVLLMVDSISRYAMALREIGLATGEPPTAKGYTPSVFANLPRLLERAGNDSKGSITGIYTILCEEAGGYDLIANQIRSLLDGHLYLSQTLAESDHFPAIDILKSLSRVMPQITSKDHLKAAGKLRSLLSAYAQAHDLIEVGAYVAGTNLQIDEAMAKMRTIKQFLQQEATCSFSLEQTIDFLCDI